MANTGKGSPWHLQIGSVEAMDMTSYGMGISNMVRSTCLIHERTDAMMLLMAMAMVAGSIGWYYQKM